MCTQENGKELGNECYKIFVLYLYYGILVYMYVNMMNIWRKIDSNVIKIFREVIKKKQVFRGHVPYQGGGSPPTFFRQNKILKKFSMPSKTFFIQIIFLYCHLCLSTGSTEIFIKNILFFH